MITASQLNIKIAAEGAQRAAADVRSVGDAVETTGNQATTGAARFSGAGQTLRSVGTGMTAAITAPILALGVGIVGMASDTNEALSAVTNVYGTAAAGVIQSSQGAATAVGLSQTQYLSATTNLAAYGKMMGLTQGQTATFADQTVSAAADLASFYNTSPEDAMSAINAGFRGEGDALEKYGIIMNQATVEQYALTSGIWDGNGAMTNAQLVQARSGYIMSQLTSETGSANAAMGDFTETSGGLANQQRILKARLLDVGASFGQVLLPIALKMVGVFGKVIGGLGAMSPVAKTVTVVIAAIAAAIGPLLIVFGSLLGAVGSVAAAFGTGGMLAWLTPLLGPIALVVAALVGLGIAYKTNFLGFGDAVRAVGSKLKDAFGGIAGVIGSFVDYVKYAAESGDWLNESLMGIPGPLKGVVMAIGKVAGGLGDATRTFGNLRKFGFDPVQAALKSLQMAFPALSGPIQVVRDIVGTLTDVFGDIVDAVRDVVSQFQTFRNAGMSPVSSAVAALSNVFTSFKDTFAAVGEAVNAGIAIFTNLKDAVTAALGGDWSSAWDSLKAAFGSLGDFITGSITAWATLVVDAFRAIPWGVVGAALMAGLTAALSGMASLGAGLWGWIVDSVSAIDFGAIGSALLAGITTAIGYIAGVASDIWGWIKDSVGAVDWAGIGTALLEGVNTAIAAITGVATDIWGWVKDSVGDIDWTGIGTALSDGITGAVAAIVDLSSKLLDKGTELVSGMLAGIVAYWPTITTWFGTVGGLIAGAVGDLASSLLGKGQDILVGLLNGIVTYWPTVTGWFGTVGSLIVGALGDLGGPVGTVVTAISTAIDTAWTLISSSWDVVKGWATNLVTDLGAGDFSAFTAPISAIATGISTAWTLIQAAWTPVAAFVTNVASGLSLPDFSSLTAVWATISTGIDTAWGLIQTAWTTVAAFISTVAGGLSLPDFSSLNAVWATISTGIDTAWGLIEPAWNTISSWISGLSGSVAAPDFTPVTDPIANIATCIDTAWTAISTAWTVVAAFITNVASGLSIPDFATLCAAFKSIADGIDTAWGLIETAWTQITGWVDGISLSAPSFDDLETAWKTISSGIDTAWTAIGTAWDQITGWADGITLAAPDFSAFLHPISLISNSISMAWELISPAWAVLTDWASTLVSSLSVPDFSAFIAPFQTFSDGIFKIVDFVTGKLGEFVDFLSNIKIPDIKLPDLSWLPFVDGPTKKPAAPDGGAAAPMGPTAPAGPSATDAVAAIGLAQSITDAATRARTAMQQIITDGYNLRTEVGAAFSGTATDTAASISSFFATVPAIFRAGVQQMMIDSTNMKIGLVQDLTDVLTTGAALMSSFFASVPAIFRAGVQQMMIDASNAKIGVVADFTDLVTSSIAQITVWAATIPTLAAQTAASVMLSVSTMKIGVVSDVNDTQATTLGVFGGWQTGMIGIASRLDASVRGSISTMKSGIVSDVRDAVNTSIAEFGRIGTEGAGKIDSGAGTVGASAYNMGAAASLGVSNGIDNYLYRVTNSVNAIVNEVDRALRAGLRVHSPSKLTAYYGEMAITGFVGDIIKGLPSVRGAIGDVVGTVASGLSGTLTGGTLAIGATGPSSYGGGPVVPTMTTSGRQAAPVTNTYHNTYQMTVSVKDVEEMVRLSRFVNDIPAAIGLVYGHQAGGTA